MLKQLHELSGGSEGGGDQAVVDAMTTWSDAELLKRRNRYLFEKHPHMSWLEEGISREE